MSGLDVERLMIAIHRTGIAGCRTECSSGLDEYPSGADGDYATLLAAEYDRLAPSTPVSDDTEGAG